MKPPINTPANAERVNAAFERACASGKVTLLPPEPRDTAWRGAWLKTLLAALVLIALVLAVQRHADRVEASAVARAEFLRAADEKCIPLQRNETAIATHDGHRVRCRVYARTGLGMVPKLVSAAVMDMPR